MSGAATWFDLAEIGKPSSFIREFAFDEASGRLFFRFHVSSVPVVYSGVDADTVTRMIFADSIGKFYNATIKGKFPRDTALESAFQCFDYL